MGSLHMHSVREAVNLLTFKKSESQKTPTSCASKGLDMYKFSNVVMNNCARRARSLAITCTGSDVHLRERLLKDTSSREPSPCL